MKTKFEYLTVYLLEDQNTKERNFHIANKKFPYEEYKTGIFEFLGSEGWELISTVNYIDSELENIGLVPISAANTRIIVSTSLIEYIFKRELEKDKSLSIEANKVKEILYGSESMETIQFKCKTKLENNIEEIEEIIKNLQFEKHGYKIGESKIDSLISIYQNKDIIQEKGLFIKKELKRVLNKRIDINLIERKKFIVIKMDFYEKENSTNIWNSYGSEEYECFDKFDREILLKIINK